MAWATHDVDVDSRGEKQVDPGATCSFITPIACSLGIDAALRGTGDVDLDGLVGEFRVRVLSPIELLGARLWLDAAYRQPLEDIDDRSGSTQLRVSYQRSALVAAGLAWPLLDGRTGLSLGAGPELGWFRAKYTPSTFLSSETESTTDMFTGVLFGLDATVVLYEKDAVTIQLLARGTYTRWLSGDRQLRTRTTLSGGTISAKARYEVENSATGSLGVGVSF